MTRGEQYSLPPLSKKTYNQIAWEARLLLVLKSLFTKFRRTFLLLDGLDELLDNFDKEMDSMGVNCSDYLKDMVKFLQEILEQDFGNVSIAIFSRPLRGLEPLLRHADVSIRVTRLEPDLSAYIHFKVSVKVKPMLVEAHLDHDQDALAVIEKVMAEASAGL